MSVVSICGAFTAFQASLLNPPRPQRRQTSVAQPHRSSLPLKRAAAAVLLPALGLSLSFARTRKPPESRPAIRPIVVGYFGQWSLYQHFLVKNLVTSGAADQLDQINYAQGFVTNGRCSVADPHADTDIAFSAQDSVNGQADNPSTTFHGNLHQLEELKRLHPRLKLLISLEGRAPDFAADAQPAAREAFVRSCVDIFLRGHLAASHNVNPRTPDQPRLFDGIDLDWEYPGGENAANFLAVLTEFRHQMDALRPGLRLTVAVGPSPRMYPGVDMAAISQLVDQVGIMNYDYIGPWSHTTGFLAPLSTEDNRGGSVDRSIVEYKQAGIPASKLLLGLPFYGYGWNAVPTPGAGLFQPGQGIRGDRPYPYFLSLLTPTATPPRSIAPEPPAATPPTLKHTAATATPAPDAKPTPAPHPYVLHRDLHSHAPWLYDGSTFWTFEDPVSIAYKAAFAAQQQLGGVMAWELSEDAPDAALIKAARQGLHHPHSAP